MTGYTIYWKHRTKVMWSGKRKWIKNVGGMKLPYVKDMHGFHWGTYAKYRQNHPDGSYKDMIKGLRKPLESCDIEALRIIDKDVKAWAAKVASIKKKSKRGK